MKKYILLILVVLVPALSVNAQNAYDIYRLQASDVYGSSRFMSMSGAFGALGGDVSSMSVNPAGVAVAKEGAISINLGAEWYANNNSFYRQTLDNKSKGLLTMPHIGAVVSVPLGYDGTSVSFGINYSVSKNFNNEYVFKGRNTTVTDWFGGNPIGSSVIESFYQNYINYGYTDQGEGLAMDTGALEKVGDDYYPGADYNDITQEGYIYRGGYNSQTTVSFGLSIIDRIYLGIGVDFLRINQKANDIELNEYGYTRNDSYAGSGVSSLEYTRLNSSDGGGVALSFGIIGRVADNFRLGISYRTPQWISIDEYYSFDLLNDFFNGDYVSAYDNPTSDEPNVYNFRSPAKLGVSAAFVHPLGLISVDYGFRDFSTLLFTTPFANFKEENEKTRRELGASHSINIGGELKVLYPVVLRAGFSYESSPFKDFTVSRVNQSVENLWTEVVLPQGVKDKVGFSLGLGFNFYKTCSLDLSYNFAKQGEYNYLYEPYLTDPVYSKWRNHRISLGFSLIF